MQFLVVVEWSLGALDDVEVVPADPGVFLLLGLERLRLLELTSW